jgi:hypothetical protein
MDMSLPYMADRSVFHLEMDPRTSSVSSLISQQVLLARSQDDSHSSPVRHYVPLKVEFPLEMLVKEDVVLGRVNAVEGLVGRHDRARSGADGLGKGGKVELVKLFPVVGGS